MKHYIYQKGFTLVEMIITLTIVIVLGIIFQNYLLRAVKTVRFIDEFNTAVEEARKGVTIMNKELRETKNSDDGSYDIESADAEQIVFFSNIDSDSQVEKIRYFLEDKKLKKGVINPVSAVYSGAETITVLSQYVENNASQPVFTYYDINNNLLTSPITISSIRMINTHLEINMTPERAPANYALDTNAHLRNLKISY